MPGKSFTGRAPPLDEREQRYRTELEATVRALASDIGERNLRRPGRLDAAAAYLEKELQRAGFAVSRVAYDVSGHTVANLEVQLDGRDKHGDIVIVGAHYDSAMGTPGADDNASGAAATLALARAFFGRRPARTLRFVFFVNEEAPYFFGDTMGSLVYARRCKARGDRIVAMLSLEMLGFYSDEEGSQHYPYPLRALYPSTGNFLGFVSNLGSRALTRRVVGSFRERATIGSEGASLPSIVPGVAWSDQWAFWNQGYPAVMVTDTAFFRNPHYHRHTDTPERLDYARFARAVRGLEAVVAELAGS